MTLQLNRTEERWVDYVAKHVVDKLEGSSAVKARAAALVTWWALKEGILDLPNPWRHNICHTGGDHPIGDLEVCSSSIWQVGMAGIQPSNLTLSQIEAVARRIYPGQYLSSVLAKVAEDANVDETTKEAIVHSAGELRKAWLLRDPAIAFTMQAPFVDIGCIKGNRSWCYGGWDTARRFASDASRVREVVGELEHRFSGSALPFGSKTSWLLLAAGLGAAYWYGSTYGYPSWVPKLLRL